MTNACTKWKDALLEAALAETADDELNRHLSNCADCTAQLEALRVRRQRLDALLPLVARAAEPSPDLSARIVAAAEASDARRRSGFWRIWAVAGAAAAIVIAAVAFSMHRSSGLTDAELRQAQELAQWQAPTDVLLQTPGRDFLNSIPRLGETYFTLQSASSSAKRSQSLKP
jgi:hypothetical protein